MEDVQMKMNTFRKRVALNILISLLLAGLNYGVWLNVWSRQEILSPGSHRLADSLLLMLGLTLVMDVVVLLQVWKEQWLYPLRRLRQRLGWQRWVVVVLAGLIPAWFYYFTPWSINFHGVYIRLIFYLFTLGLMAWLAAGSYKSSFDWQGWMVALILLGSQFALGAAFREVSNFPFGLYWSEGNRFYDYSLLFGQGLYDFPSGKPLTPYLSLGRQGLWGLYFLLPKISIFGMRLWNGIIFTIPYFILGWLCIKWQGKSKAARWVFALWAFLFLNQGPIYTPLILAAILVALARRMPLWAGWLVMLVAGFYASLSRETWLFAPAMWMATISLVEAKPVDVRSLKTFLTMLIKPLDRSGLPASSSNQLRKTPLRRSWVEGWRRAIVFGFCGLLGGYILPSLIPQLRIFLPGGGSALSAEGVAQLVERQPLLWDRLWPNATYSPGIILALLMAMAPLVILIFTFISQGRWRQDIWQKLAMVMTSLAFLGVGIVVSVKIGGGSNLHNLDMLLISLLFVAGLAWEEGGSGWVVETKGSYGWTRLLVTAALVIPSLPGVMQATFQANPSAGDSSKYLSSINQAVLGAQNQGEILFMDQRQLLTFGYVKDVPLVSEYEKKRMMDEALANNGRYFAPFYKDMSNRRFSLIISEPLWVNFQEGQKGFSNENNAWVNWVSVPVLCYYKPVATYMEIGVQLLVPQEKTAPAPGVVCPEN
jgi:hypothetical protein